MCENCPPHPCACTTSPNREAAMVTVKPGVWCDPCIASLVAALAAWCKTWHQIRPTTVQFAWEPVIFCGGRTDPKRSPMVRDWFSCPVTRQRGLKGAKPAAFNQWVLDLLAFDPEQDTIDDLFPGTGSMAHTLARRPLDFGGVA